MPNSSQSDIQGLIEQFTTDLTTLVRRNTLEEVLTSLQGGKMSGAAIRGRGRPRGTGRGPGRPPNSGSGVRERRSSEGLEEMQSKLLSHVGTNPGQRGEQIAAALGSDVGTIRLPMKKLIAAGQIRTEGQRRGMTYSLGGDKSSSGAAKKGRRAGRRKKT